jgi:hypothetical protein
MTNGRSNTVGRMTIARKTEVSIAALVLLLMTVFFTTTAHCQVTTTTITGTVRDLANATVTSGTIKYTLRPSADSTISLTSRYTPTVITCKITVSGIKANDGTSACVITKNTVLTPGGTYYQADICPYGACTSKLNFFAFSDTLDFSTVIPTPATSPLYGQGQAGPPGPIGPQGPPGSGTTAQERAFVNGVTDCSIPTNTITPMGATLNACILAHPHQRIILPPLVSGGGTDYNATDARIDVKGGVTLIGGGNCSVWAGEMVKIQFASGSAGIRLDTDNTGGGLHCLSVMGGDPFCGNVCNTSSQLKNYEDFDAEADFQGTSHADGVQVLSKNALSYVYVFGFKGNGFLINGAATGQPDLVRTDTLVASFNRGYGFYLYGTDANVGLYPGVNCWYNALGCNKDSAFYGNTWIAPHSSGNASFQAVSAGANKTITSETVDASNVKTIVVNTHGWVVDNWIKTTGEVDGTFGGTCKITVVVDVNTVQCPFTHAAGSTTGGTGATAAASDISAYYAAKGIKTGSYITTATAGCALFITPYTESTSKTPDWGCALTIQPQGVNNYTSGFHISTDTTSNLWMRGGGVVMVPNAASGRYFEIMDTTGATVKLAVDMNAGSLQTTGKIRVRDPVSLFGAFNDGLELPNGITSGIAFRCISGLANCRAMYLDGSDVVQMPNANGYALSGTTTLARAKVNAGITNGTGLAHGRVTTGSVALSSSAAVTLTWGINFGDANYTTVCNVLEATTSVNTLHVHHIESQTSTTVVVRVKNDDTGAAHTGTLHCHAFHD